MRVIDIEDVVYAMRNQTQFVLRCEEVFHDKISSAAAAILSAQPRKPFVCLTGPPAPARRRRRCACRRISKIWASRSVF